MNTFKLSNRRYGVPKSTTHDHEGEYLTRTPFSIDYDRLIFSNAFRRLSRKTQVHPLAKNDHIHNRLTHSLEVASVGRSLGLGIEQKILQNDPNFCSHYDIAMIVQSACLAHDIGNPPFGHAGEEVIKAWFQEAKAKNSEYVTPLSSKELSDFISFDGNAQSFRIVTQIENNPKNGGMHLTYSTLASMIKYPWESHDKRSKNCKFGFFQSEKEIAREILKHFAPSSKKTLLRYPLSHLMEIADDICYALLDIKDAIELGILRLEETKEVFTLLCENTYKEVNTSKKYKSYSDFQKGSILCARAINNLTNEALNTFINKDFLTPTDTQGDLLSSFENKDLKQGLQRAKKLGHEKIFNTQRKIELELGAYESLGILLKNLIHAAYTLDKEGESLKNKHLFTLMQEYAPKKHQTLYERYQMVLDFITSMTDNSATYLARQLSGVGI